jgi:hypothetical protein
VGGHAMAVGTQRGHVWNTPTGRRVGVGPVCEGGKRGHVVRVTSAARPARWYAPPVLWGRRGRWDARTRTLLYVCVCVCICVRTCLCSMHRTMGDEVDDDAVADAVDEQLVLGCVCGCATRIARALGSDARCTVGMCAWVGVTREDGQPLSKKALKKLEAQKKKDALKAEKAAKLVSCSTERERGGPTCIQVRTCANVHRGWVRWCAGGGEGGARDRRTSGALSAQTPFIRLGNWVSVLRPHALNDGVPHHIGALTPLCTHGLVGLCP